MWSWDTKNWSRGCHSSLRRVSFSATEAWTPWGVYKELGNTARCGFSSLIITNIFPQINTPKSYRKMRYKSVTCEKKSWHAFLTQQVQCGLRRTGRLWDVVSILVATKERLYIVSIWTHVSHTEFPRIVEQLQNVCASRVAREEQANICEDWLYIVWRLMTLNLQPTHSKPNAICT